MWKCALTLMVFATSGSVLAQGQTRINLINIQVQGVPNAEQIKAGYKDKRWQGEMQQLPINMRNKPENQINGIARSLPFVKNIRLPFNTNSFNKDGTFHPEFERWLSEAAKQNFQILWVLMDGPSQEAQRSSLDDYRKLMPELRSRQTAAFTKLVAWLKKHPEQKILGFEAINEPATYSRPGSKATVQNEFVGYYVDHVEAIFKIVNANFPRAKFFIGGWKYSAWFDVFQKNLLISKGNVSALEYFRRMAGAQLIWSVHLYPHWLEAAKSQEEYEAKILERISPILNEPVVVTEINAINDIANDPYYSSEYQRIHFINARAADFFVKHNLGIGWWVGVNYGNSMLMFVARNAEVEITHQNTLAAGYHFFSAGNHPDLFTGSQWGRKSLTVLSARKIEVAATAPSHAGQLEPVNLYTLGFGGAGNTVLEGRDDAINFLYGGDGRSTIYGGKNNDHLYGGNGGGVIRTGGGDNTVTTYDGDDRIFTGNGHNVVSAGKGRNTIVVDPEGETVIYRFRPEDGDRLSMKRAFKANAAMKSAIKYDTRFDGTVDLVIATPQGGYVRLLGRGDLTTASMVKFNLDLTDGWYAPGWQEPVDFLESDLQP